MKVLLNCKSNSAHLQQLYTGLNLLHQSGKIRLSQRVEQCEFDNSEKYILEADVEGRKIIFDAKDADGIHYELLNTCDYYFKRSYDPDIILRQYPAHSEKIKPLGLNYLVYPDNLDKFTINRRWTLRKSNLSKIRAILFTLDFLDLVKFKPRLRYMHSNPGEKQPQVLFCVTAYDPKHARNKIAAEERKHINHMRANCIRVMRKELGDRYYGGFVHNKYTIENYKDLLIDDPHKTKKANYLDLLKQFSIGVATTGLHRSIGWKFAEYVAFSRAIVSEPLNFRVPGNLAAGKHYLEFSTPDQCVEQCLKLLDNKKLRFDMMKSNHKYYRNYLKPDVLVWNAIVQVIPI